MINDGHVGAKHAFQMPAFVKRRKVLTLGTLATALSGASLAGISKEAIAVPNDKPSSSSYVPTAEKGAPSGVATLDSGIKIPSAQIPDLSAAYAQASAQPAWKPGTAYGAGMHVVSPSGSLVKAKTSFISDQDYNAADWIPVATAAMMPRYYDESGSFVDRGAILTLSRNHDPSGFQPLIWANVSGKGDNATFKGVVAGQFLARDRSDVHSGNKGVLYALQAVVAPRADRNNVPFDDVVGLSIVNQGTGIGTDALYFGHNRADRVSNPGAKDFSNVIQNDMSSDSFIRSIGRHDVGISLSGATISTTAIRLGNSQSISWNDDGGNLTHAIRFTAKGTLRLLEGGLDIRSDKSVYFNNKIVLSNNSPLYGIRSGSTSEYELIKLTPNDNVALFGARATILATGGVTLQNIAKSPISAPESGTLYVEGGALKYMGSTGTITTIGLA